MFVPRKKTEASALGHIDLYIVDLDQWAANRLDVDALTAEDRAQAKRLRDPLVARRLSSRRSVTRTVVAHALGFDPSELSISRHCPKCGASDHGRPFVPNALVNFSVSSSGGVAAIALSHEAVGVDLETHQNDVLPQFAALTNEEQRAVKALPSIEQGPGFLRLWTAKEALLKASARSLADDPATIDVLPVLTSDTAEVSDDGRKWHIRLLQDVGAEVLTPVVVALVDQKGLPLIARSVQF